MHCNYLVEEERLEMLQGDKKLYEALYNRLPKHNDLDDQVDESIDFILQNNRQEHFIAILKNGGFYESVWTSIMFEFGMSIGMEWYQKSKMEKDKIVAELLNRFYGLTFSYRKEKKPLIRRRKTINKHQRKQKYTKKIRAVKSRLLFYI